MTSRGATSGRQLTRRHLIFGLIAVIGIIALVGMIVQQIARSSERPIVDTRGIVLKDSYVVTGDVDGDLVIAADNVTFDENSHVDGSVSVIGSIVNVNGSVDGDLTIFSDSLVIASGAAIDGDLSFIGSNAQISGTVNGEVSVTGERILFSADAQFAGDISACTGTLNDERSDIGDEAIRCRFSRWFEPVSALIALRDAEFISPFQGSMSVSVNATPAEMLAGGVLSSLFMAGMAGLAVTIFPRHISRIEEAIRSNPRMSGSVGLATFLLGFGITVGMVIFIAVLPPVGLLLIPLYILALTALLIFTFAGWVTLSLVIGDWIMSKTGRMTSRSTRLSTTHRIIPPLISAVIGSFALSLFGTVISLIPLGWLISLAILGGASSVGLGAALSTRMGTRSPNRTTFVQG